ncbi:sulfotransferase family protein [Methylobacterium isbiliense]|uniref:Sulfotransferase family protein n=1 Tax=Methylobacterium isbiliense TaxID=315478 RepID=A0ABQ4SFC3_9HYPH|nr:sulfotransferase family protein [Methylobacterium isbiliense]MDN3625361.1 sulfotransferase family protein [Methylobacterium isbiliense]GJE01081.1 hypothetical protein GMJLKIPL_3010 [Methylobacterium isbiliense]
MAPLFFLHIPKTAGTSLRYSAHEVFPKEKIFMLYGKDSPTTHPFANELMYYRQGVGIGEQLRLISDYLVEHEIAFYSSHMSAAYLPCFDPGRAFSLFRSPCEQVLSYYVFQKRHGRTSQSLEEFIEEPRNQNVQTHSFGSADLERIALVGILEEYEAFVARLNRRFGLSFKSVHKNARSLASRLAGPKPSPALRAYIERLNGSDMDLYRRAASRWSVLARAAA